MPNLLETIRIEAEGKDKRRLKELMSDYDISNLPELTLSDLDSFYADLKKLPGVPTGFASPKPGKSVHVPASSVSMSQTVLLVEQKICDLEHNCETLKVIRENCLRDLVAAVGRADEGVKALDATRAELEQLYYQFPETRKQVENFLND